MTDADAILAMARDAGAFRAAVIRAVPVQDDAAEMYRRLLREGRHGPMEFMERYDDVRDDPRLLIDVADGGPAQSMVICLFAYPGPRQVPSCDPGVRVAHFALAAEDYHNVLRRRLTPVADAITAACGGTARVCVDSAPLRERYWAARAGLGIIGRNNHLVVPGFGAAFHIAAILTTAILSGAETPPPLDLRPSCPDGCIRCVLSCPTGALSPDGSCDTGRCISCLTIENCRSALPDTPDGTRLPRRGYIFGCDICRLACPRTFSAGTIDTIPELSATDTAVMSRDSWLALGSGAFRRLFSHTAIARAGLRGIRANLARTGDGENESLPATKDKNDRASVEDGTTAEN